MPYQIQFELPPAGYAISATQKGDRVPVQFIEFTTTEDGQHFISRLEGIPNHIVEMVRVQNPDVHPAQINHLLALINKDGSAKVYINELQVISHVRVGRPVKQGQGVYKDDIIDFTEARFDGVEIPNDVGIVLVFSSGWRKGLFYDFGPLPPNELVREYNFSTLFGQFNAQLMFQERFAILESEWSLLLDSGWFPFACLTNDTVKMLITCLRENWELDQIISKIHDEITNKFDFIIDSWRHHSAFRNHIEIFERAIERYQNNDYISCSAILYPRIEGILRDCHFECSEEKATQQSMSASAVATLINNPACLLLPDKFEKYLRQVYFAGFDPTQSDHVCNRNTVGHGVASISRFDQQSALIGILVAHQLFYCVENRHSGRSIKPELVSAIDGEKGSL